MNNDLVAKSTVTIHSNQKMVWNALTDPSQIKKYMFGADVESDWKVGSPITWKGEFEGKGFEDKGEITDFVPGEKLGYTHYSAMSGKPDKPENYHNVTITLEQKDDAIRVILNQGGNASEKEREGSQKNWVSMLQGLKKTVEGDA